tara:strand:+ start:34 stop:876 length:843 start_codon:yes stop_codon:yes gene_type:complete
MIIWLASYPKSGNTLLRSILASYFYSNDGSLRFKDLYNITQFPLSEQFLPLGIDIDNDKEVFKNFINAQKLINQEKEKIKFFKTHSSLCRVYDNNFTDLHNTLGAIYIVRDPRNVVTSFAHHYNLTIDEAAETMVDKNKFMQKTSRNLRVFIGSWNFSYNSWKNLKDQNKYLLIKYEDLITKKRTVLIKVFKFLNSLGMKFNLDMVKLNKVIKNTEFEKMKIKEKNEIFSEAVTDKDGKKKVFFNLGPKNDWRRLLDKKNKDKIEHHFEKEMIELGYLKF